MSSIMVWTRTSCAIWRAGGSERSLAIPSLALTTDLANLFDSQSESMGTLTVTVERWERPASLELLTPMARQASNRIPACAFVAGTVVAAQIRNMRSDSSSVASTGQHVRLPDVRYRGHAELQKARLANRAELLMEFCGDPSNTFISDVFARELQRDMGQPYTRSNWYHLYINGQYWGLFQTQEPIRSRVCGQLLRWFRIELRCLETRAGPYEIYATDGNDQAYRRLWQAAHAGFASNEDYLKVQGKNPDGTENPITNLCWMLIT